MLALRPSADSPKIRGAVRKKSARSHAGTYPTRCVGTTTIAQFALAVIYSVYLARLDWGAAARVIMALHLDDLTEVIAAPTGGARLERLSVRGVGDLADWEGQGQRMAWGSALATQYLEEGARSHDRARDLLH